MGAILMRAIMIVSGAALIHRFEWIIHVFGAFVILTGIKMFLQRNKEPDVENSGLLRWLRRRIPLTNEYDGQNFFTRLDGRLLATPLFFVLVLVEITDLLFALDSIPAIFAVTSHPFVVFTSNIFAILGLRSLYFLLAGVMQLFHYLSVGLSAILIFVGLKMVGLIGIPIGYSLLVIAAILAASIGASLLKVRRERQAAPPGQAEEEGSGGKKISQ
jgi:tellurite resistance protein TerC